MRKPVARQHHRPSSARKLCRCPSQAMLPQKRTRAKPWTARRSRAPPPVLPKTPARRRKPFTASLIASLIASLKPDPTATVAMMCLPDRGFGVRITATGAKTFIHRYRIDVRLHRAMQIGSLKRIVVISSSVL